MELTTERLMVREFREADWPIVRTYQSDSRFLRYYAWTERTQEAVKALVQRKVDQQYEQPRTNYQLAITLRPDGELIGSCGLQMTHAGAYEAETGYQLAAAYWGRGYATEAARAMMEFGFAELSLHRIWAHCVADNVASARVLEKLGMRLEGRMRHKERFKGRWWDRLLYGILEDEWRASR